MHSRQVKHLSEYTLRRRPGRTSYLPTKTSANPPTARRSPRVTRAGSTAQRCSSAGSAPETVGLSAAALHRMHGISGAVMHAQGHLLHRVASQHSCAFWQLLNPSLETPAQIQRWIHHSIEGSPMFHRDSPLVNPKAKQVPKRKHTLGMNTLQEHETPSDCRPARQALQTGCSRLTRHAPGGPRTAPRAAAARAPHPPASPGPWPPGAPRARRPGRRRAWRPRGQAPAALRCPGERGQRLRPGCRHWVSQATRCSPAAAPAGLLPESCPHKQRQLIKDS